MEIERTKNTINGVIWGVINVLVTLVLPFISRTCIIYLLGANYVGLSSLFSSVLTVLSLAELGFGSAVIYSMYRPIAEGDESRICVLMQFYKTVYRVIGLVVLAVGLSLLPFLPYFVKADLPTGMNLYALYAIYLGNAVLSYWLFAYKNCLLTATQRYDVISKISSAVNIIVYSVQIIILFAFRDYYLYSACIIAVTVSVNFATAWKVQKMYPNLKCRGKLEREEIRPIMKQVSGLMIQRCAYISRNSFDSIIISAYLGLVLVGIYNNYFYILNALTSILAVLFSSMQGGLGNSIVKESLEKNHSDYCRIGFLYMMIAGWCCCCLLVLFQPFMRMWVGEKMMFPFGTVSLLVVYFYAMKMTDTTGAYITVTGLWWRCKWSYIAEAGMNLALNFVLGYLWGVTGIIIATILTVFVVNYLLNTYILYKYFFVGFDYSKQILKNLKYFVISAAVCTVTYLTASQIPEQKGIPASLASMAMKCMICVIVPAGLYWVIYRRNPLFLDSMRWVKNKLEIGKN